MSPRPLWLLTPQDPHGAGVLAEALGCSPLIGQVLVNRGLAAEEGARAFLEDGLSDLPDPYLAGDMEKAVARVRQALARGERIAVHGDYDVDGITATALLTSFLQEVGGRAEAVIPLRMEDGYGLSSDRVRQLAAAGVTLVVTVDCGISAKNEISLARSLGVDVVVTDHHEPPLELPSDAAALVDPLLPGCAFPDKRLAGVGIAFYLAAGIRKGMREAGDLSSRPEPDLSSWLDLAAVGTIADIVPLRGVNRILAREGLAAINRGPRPGMEALLSVSGVAMGEVDAAAVAYRLAPRINAAGRLGDAAAGVRLLTTDDPAEAEALAESLDAENVRRQRIEEEIFASALEQATRSDLASRRRSLVLHQADWHPGVIGIVASRLAERFNRPAVLLTGGEGMLKGSARGVPGFHLFDALTSCRDLLAEFGGHRHAAGISVAHADLAAFADRFEREVERVIPEGGFPSRILLDAAVPLPLLTREEVEGLGQLAPFGAGNPEPLLFVGGVRMNSPRIVGNGHLLFTAAANGSALPAIAFRQGHELRHLPQVVDLAAVPEIDIWRGIRRLRLRVKAMRPAAPLQDAPRGEDLLQA